MSREKKPKLQEISDHMRKIAHKRWRLYAERVARGEITAENYVYRPRGPMSLQSKAKQDFARWERQIANAQIVRMALDGERLSQRQLEQIGGEARTRKRRRLHLRFGGKPPKYPHLGRRSTLRVFAPDSGEESKNAG